jgi:hypothetical protein
MSARRYISCRVCGNDCTGWTQSPRRFDGKCYPCRSLLPEVADLESPNTLKGRGEWLPNGHGIVKFQWKAQV